MQEVVQVSNVEKTEKLKMYLEESFKNARYPEITQAIGLHSIFIDPQHTMKDQSNLYHGILQMIKDRISKSKGKSYGAWYANFPTLMGKLASTNQGVTDKGLWRSSHLTRRHTEHSNLLMTFSSGLLMTGE